MRLNSTTLIFYFKAAVLIAVFIVLGNLIAAQTGIAEQLSNIFYWPNEGQVAGEFEVRAAQVQTPNFNPPYPRIGQITFYSAGAGDEIWKNHDLVVIRGHRGSDAKRIKEKNPDAILLAANGDIAWTKDLERFMKDDPQLQDKLPEVWYAHYSDGSRVDGWGAYVMNITENCPEFDMGYGPQKYNEFLPRIMTEKYDWHSFDGVLFDTWGSLTWLDNVSDIEFTPGDFEEGKEILVQNFRSLLPNKLVLAHEAGELYLNGNAFEFWTQETPGSRGWNMGEALDLIDQAVAPQLNYANGNANGSGSVFRADFTSAQIVGAFFGHDEGTFAHRWTFLHDEYEGNLGYPTSEPQEIEDGLWLRYFDNGVVISNISGTTKTVTARQLNGGPYYRFKGNQVPDVNNGQIVDEAHPIYLNGTFDSKDAGTVIMDGIMLFKKPTTLVTPIIIDNISINMTTVGQQPASYSGSWTQLPGATDTETAYYLGVGWGNNVEPYAKTTGSGIATYEPQINVPGPYEIYEWHPDTEVDGQGTGCSNVQITIGSDTKTVNQQTNAGQWNSLGIYNFTDSARVMLTAPGGCTTASDAIRFVYRDGNSPSAKKGDLNNDSKVDVKDLGILMSNWGKQDKGKHDLNSDGATNSQDFWELLKKWPGLFSIK